MLLKALGVEDDEVYANYLESNQHHDADRHDGRIATLMESLFGVGLGADALQAITAARRDYLAAALDEVGRCWGSVGAYLEVCAGLDAALRTDLRRVLLE